MSETRDPLEAELAAVRPHQVSPELRQRIGESLAESSPTRKRRGWWFALAGGLAAACLTAVLFWRGNGPDVAPKPVVLPPPARHAEVEDGQPTLLAYQRALSRSPEALDALLDSQAADAPEHNPESVPLGAFPRSDAVLHALLGDD
jgi:hypothetical protein